METTRLPPLPNGTMGIAKAAGFNTNNIRVNALVQETLHYVTVTLIPTIMLYSRCCHVVVMHMTPWAANHSPFQFSTTLDMKNDVTLHYITLAHVHIIDMNELKG